MKWSEFKAMVEAEIEKYSLGDPTIETIDCWITEPHGLHGHVGLCGFDIRFKLDGQEVDSEPF